MVELAITTKRSVVSMGFVFLRIQTRPRTSPIRFSPLEWWNLQSQLREVLYRWVCLLANSDAAPHQSYPFLPARMVELAITTKRSVVSMGFVFLRIRTRPRTSPIRFSPLEWWNLQSQLREVLYRWVLSSWEFGRGPAPVLSVSPR